MTSHLDDATARNLYVGDTEAEHGASPLPAPVQEHLARQLRATYQVMAAKPAYLGDPALPLEFERHIERLASRERAEIREKVHNLGIEAVEAALEEVVSGAIAPEELAANPRLRRSA